MAKLTEARRRVLGEIAASGREGARPTGAALTLTYGFIAWKWVEQRHVRGFLQPRYFITDAGRLALAEAASDTPVTT